MSSGTGERRGLDELLDRLEKAITRLADGRAPLEELVSAHEEAHRLADQAEAELGRLAERLEPRP